MNPRDKSEQPLRLRVTRGWTPMSLGKDQHTQSRPTRKERGRPLRLGGMGVSQVESSTAFNRLCQQVLRSVAPGVKGRCWTCVPKGRLRLFLPDASVQTCDLAGLYDHLLATSASPEFNRLAAIYAQCLETVVARNFCGTRRRQLEKSLKALIILRLLGVPYRAGSPIPGAAEEGLLSSLHILCQGAGLMAWNENGNPVYVVENDPERYVEWVVTRMTAFLGRNERDKAVADALWSKLFSVPEGGVRQELLPAGSQPCSLLLSGDVFSGREALLIQWPGAGKWVVAFESPWKVDQGRRVHRVMRALPGEVSSGRVLIWVPRRLLPREEEQVVCYMAIARALRMMPADESADETGGWLMRALQRAYLSASKLALEAILDSYRQGMVVADRGMWYPDQRTDSLVCLVRELMVWVRSEEAHTQQALV
jgi:hypothetical protein